MSDKNSDVDVKQEIINGLLGGTCVAVLIAVVFVSGTLACAFIAVFFLM